MTSPQENRTYNRFPHNASLICSPFNTDVHYNTQKHNHGGGGLCFESNVAFQRGTVLNIRMEDFSAEGLSSEAWDGFRTMAVGEVRWCQEINDVNGNRFNVGVKYYEPAY